MQQVNMPILMRKHLKKRMRKRKKSMRMKKEKEEKKSKQIYYGNG